MGQTKKLNNGVNCRGTVKGSNMGLKIGGIRV